MSKEYTIRKDKVDVTYDPHTKNHWKRTRKAEVDLLHGSAFVLDRQLEDQKYQLEFNKNPRAYENTKMDRTRSEIMIARKGNAAPINTKVKALNKIVREASGVYNYALVAPPKREGDAKIPEVYDIDTHPLTKPYRDASKTNPSVCSFGHRPSSASRTFHPATMNIHLKKGEIVKPGANGKTGFGLTPANLAKIIAAPKYVSLEDSLNLNDTNNNYSAFTSNSMSDPFGLFTAPQQQEEEYNMDYAAQFGGRNEEKGSRLTSHSAEPNGRTRSNHNSMEGGGMNDTMSLTSQSQSSANKLRKLGSENNLDIGAVSKSKVKNSRVLDPLPIDRPTWDDWHHRVDLEERLRGKYKLRASGLDIAEIPLAEKLTRYAKLTTVDVKEPKMFCKEKWDLDTALHNGTVTHSQLGGRGQSNYLYDADNEKEFIKLKRIRKKYDKELKMKHDFMDFVSELEAVPDVPYQPSVLVSSIQSTLHESTFKSTGGEDAGEMPTQTSYLSSSQSCAAIENAAKQIIKSPELVIDRGPFLDLSRPKSPWGRGPSDNYSVPRPKEHLLPSEKVYQFLDVNSNVPVAKDFVFSKKKGTKKGGDFPLTEPTSAESPSKKAKKTKKKKGKHGEQDDDDEEMLLHADTTPALSAEMDAVAANLLSGEVVVDNTRKAPATIPVIYCGPDWEKYYKGKKKISQYNKESEITQAAVPSVSEYIASLRNRTDFEFENKHTYKKTSSATTRSDESKAELKLKTSTNINESKNVSDSETKEEKATASKNGPIAPSSASSSAALTSPTLKSATGPVAKKRDNDEYKYYNESSQLHEDKKEDELSPPGTAESDNNRESIYPDFDVQQELTAGNGYPVYGVEESGDLNHQSDSYVQEGGGEDDDRPSSTSFHRRQEEEEEDEEKYDATVRYDDD